jgi:hypothetical protein
MKASAKILDANKKPLYRAYVLTSTLTATNINEFDYAVLFIMKDPSLSPFITQDL